MTEQNDIISNTRRELHDMHITRRSMLKQAALSGLLPSGIPILLDACADTAPPANSSDPIQLTWESEHSDSGTYEVLVQAYNRVNKDGITVAYKNSPGGDDQHKLLVDRLKRRQPDPDIISTDIVWTAEFASKRWIIPISDLWPTSDQKNYLQPSIQASMYQGQVWAAPFRADVGLLYYRTDIVTDQPPFSWDDLRTWIQYAGRLPDKPAYGYLWQGKLFEGLVCNFIEVLSSFQGSILGPHNPRYVTIHTQAARDTLNQMREWIADGISPAAVTIHDQDVSAGIWYNGDTVFMRNWPTYIALSNRTSNPKVATHFQVTGIPANKPGEEARSCLGGWGLAINAFSSPEKRVAAWKFIQWMLSEEVQLFAAADASFTVTHQNVYHGNNRNYLEQQNPLYGQLYDIIVNHSQTRPQIPNYQDASSAIQNAVYEALTAKNPSLDKILADLQATLQKIVSTKP